MLSHESVAAEADARTWAILERWRGARLQGEAADYGGAFHQPAMAPFRLPGGLEVPRPEPGDVGVLEKGAQRGV